MRGNKGVGKSFTCGDEGVSRGCGREKEEMTKPIAKSGEIISVWRFLVKCDVCGAEASSEVDALGYFQSNLRSVGWSDKGGKWVCPKCV